MNQPLSAMGEPDTALERTVAEMIVSSLNLEVSPDNIQPDSALYGNGLGLDSIDILEVALVVSKHFGIQMKADSEDNFQIFSSLRSLTAYIAEHRTK
jgi:acyl carrier protein